VKYAGRVRRPGSLEGRSDGCELKTLVERAAEEGGGQDWGQQKLSHCCVERRLVVELDGGHHADNLVADGQRTDYLKKQDFRVVRFWDNEVLNNMDGVLHAILVQLQETSRDHR
jgi:Protein of unknown function (DUF559)